MDFLRYELWPKLKVRFVYWWWIIKYGGKKNIPPELIFKKMTESMSNMRENLKNALRAMPSDVSAEETKELINLLRTAGELEEEANNLGK